MMYTITTQYKRVGGVWHGQAKVTGPHGTKVIRMSVPISEGIAALKAKGVRVNISGDEVGWFGSDLVKGAGSALHSVAKAASSITKAKLVKKLGGVVKDVVTSNITKVAVGTLAIAFPPVGAPAAAALATALTVVQTAKTADRMIGKVDDVAKRLQSNPNEALKAGIAYAATGDASQAAALFNTPAGKAKLGHIAGKLRAGIQAKKVIAETVARAAKGDPGAIKFAKSLAIAKQADRKLSALKSTVAASRRQAGILVLPSGELLRGNFATGSTRRV
jgi:soluble P-type ATPase